MDNNNIPIRICSCLSTSSAPVEDDVCGWLFLSHSIYNEIENLVVFFCHIMTILDYVLQRYELFPKLANLSIIIYANRPGR